MSRLTINGEPAEYLYINDRGDILIAGYDDDGDRIVESGGSDDASVEIAANFGKGIYWLRVDKGIEAEALEYTAKKAK